MTTKIDLKQTSLIDLKRATTPAEYARILRAQGKIVFWHAAQFYLVTDAELAREVTKNPAFSADRSSFFVSRMPNLDLSLIRDFFSLVQKMMVMSDGREHETRRKAAALGIDGELLEHYQPFIEQSVDRLLTRASASGRMDFATAVAEPLPSTVLADLFRIPEGDRETFYDASLKMTAFFGGAVTYDNPTGIAVNAAASFIRDYFRDLIARRRVEPGRDFFSVLLANQARFRLTDDEILAQAVMMLVAGQVTTTDQLNNNLFQLLEHNALPLLRARSELLPTAIEECNRLDPGVTYLFRTVKQPVTLGGVELKPEDVVFVSNHSVNRDPALFDAPDEFRADRAKNPHFAYGHGPHFCLGSRLARIQMNTLFGAMVKRFPNVRLDPEHPPVRNHYALSFSGFRSLPLLLS